MPVRPSFETQKPQTLKRSTRAGDQARERAVAAVAWRGAAESGRRVGVDPETELRSIRRGLPGFFAFRLHGEKNKLHVPSSLP